MLLVDADDCPDASHHADTHRSMHAMHTKDGCAPAHGGSSRPWRARNSSHAGRKHIAPSHCPCHRRAHALQHPEDTPHLSCPSPYSLAAQNSSYSPRGELGRHLERPPRHDIQPRASPRTCTLSTDVQRPDGRPACFMCAPHAHGSMPMERSWARRASMRRTMTRCSAARTSCSAWSTSGGTSTHAVPCSWA